MKYIFGLVVVIAIVGGAYWYGVQQASAPASTEAKTTAETIRSMPMDFEWQFADEGTNEQFSMPQTRVSLVVRGGINNTYDLGVVGGSCSVVADLLPNEVSGVLCWFAGVGTEFGVFTEGEGYVVKKGAQEEPTAETDGFRGDFVTVLEIK